MDLGEKAVEPSSAENLQRVGTSQALKEGYSVTGFTENRPEGPESGAGAALKDGGYAPITAEKKRKWTAKDE